MQITEAIVHGLAKAANSNAVTKNLRSAILQSDGLLTHLGDAVLKVYGGTTNNYGCFDEDQQTFTFSGHLQAYFNGKTGLLDFSRATANLIADRMGESLLATGGYALFLRYASQDRDWLMIAMLKLKAGTGIDGTLNLTDALAFDISHLHEAARIDLGKWQNGDEPYLSFVKKSGRTDEVTRYFRRALGCTEYTDSKKNTKAALDAVEAYCAAQGWTGERRQTARKAMHTYCDEKHREGEPINLTALSARIHDQEPESFVEFVRQNHNDYPVSESFAPHRATYQRLQRISGRVGNVVVSFDVEDLVNDKIYYDEESDSLIVRNIPAKLKEDILRAQGNAATAN